VRDRRSWRNSDAQSARREQRGLSELVAAVRGVSLVGVRAIEAGKRSRLNHVEIIGLARALGVEPGSLFVVGVA
jgi:transcriptional regulator with XRE-family HTH domain